MDTATATAFPVFVKTEPIEDLLAAAFSSQESVSRSSVDSYPSSDDSSPRQGGGVASTDRRRELNRCAAKRYRERKRLEQLKRLEEFTGLELRNKELRGRVQSLEQEIRLLVSCLPGEFRLQLSKSEDSLKICKVEPLDDLASTSSLPVSSSQLSALAAFCLPLLMRTGVATQE